MVLIDSLAFPWITKCFIIHGVSHIYWRTSLRIQSFLGSDRVSLPGAVGITASEKLVEKRGEKLRLSLTFSLAVFRAAPQLTELKESFENLKLWL